MEMAVGAIIWLVIGLTIVAIGTSVPELAASLAAVIEPMSVAPEVLYRDWTLMLVLTVGLLVYVAYTGYLLSTGVASAHFLENQGNGVQAIALTCRGRPVWKYVA